MSPREIRPPGGARALVPNELKVPEGAPAQPPEGAREAGTAAREPAQQEGRACARAGSSVGYLNTPPVQSGIFLCGLGSASGRCCAGELPSGGARSLWFSELVPVSGALLLRDAPASRIFTKDAAFSGTGGPELDLAICTDSGEV